LLDFSDAEIQVLFPAPVSRRQLLIHRMVRSQLGLLFASVVAGVFVPSASGFSRVRTSVAMWFLLVTAKIYFTGISLARARLRSHDVRSRRVAWLPVAILVAAISIVGRSLTQAYTAHPPTGVIDGLALVDGIAHRLSLVVLWPFMAITRRSSPWPGPYLDAIAWAALLLVAIVAWVLTSDSTFEEAAADAAARRSKEPAGQAVTYRVRSSGWALAATGRPEAAFAWKAAMQTVRIVDKRTLARSAVILSLLTMAAMSFGRANGVAATFGAFATARVLFDSPRAADHADGHADLRHLELLKTWPVKASAVVRGELLWPGALITVIAWAMIGVSLFLSPTVFSTVDLDWRAATGAAVVIVTPALVFAQLAIHNGVVLILPSWVPLWKQLQRGLDRLVGHQARGSGHHRSRGAPRSEDITMDDLNRLFAR
jgi:hypothetical protein